MLSSLASIHIPLAKSKTVLKHQITVQSHFDFMRGRPSCSTDDLNGFRVIFCNVLAEISSYTTLQKSSVPWQGLSSRLWLFSHKVPQFLHEEQGFAGSRGLCILLWTLIFDLHFVFFATCKFLGWKLACQRRLHYQGIRSIVHAEEI